MSSRGWSKRHPNARRRNDGGHEISSQGWLKFRPNVSCCREAGHATLFTGRLKCSPNVICSSDGGHSTSSTDWLNAQPSVRRCSEAGHTTVSIEWLNLCLKVSCRTDSGHHAVSISSPSAGSADSHSNSSDPCEIHSTDVFSTRTFTRILGTRRPRLSLSYLSRSRRSHRRRGVSASTTMREANALRQAVHRSTHTSCKCLAGTYHDCPSLTPLRATRRPSIASHDASHRFGVDMRRKT